MLVWRLKWWETCSSLTDIGALTRSKFRRHTVQNHPFEVSLIMTELPVVYVLTDTCNLVLPVYKYSLWVAKLFRIWQTQSTICKQVVGMYSSHDPWYEKPYTCTPEELLSHSKAIKMIDQHFCYYKLWQLHMYFSGFTEDGSTATSWRTTTAHLSLSSFPHRQRPTPGPWLLWCCLQGKVWPAPLCG